jgi:group I intron endonuclease
MLLIYLIKNLANGKIYVGKTSQDLAVRWRQHVADSYKKYPINRAITKYGEDAFRKRVLAYATCEDELNRLEQFFICYYRSYRRKIGYNLSLGGEGVRHSIAARRKMRRNWDNLPKSERAKRLKILEDARNSIDPEHRGGAQLGEKNHLWGTHHSAKTRAKISAKAKAHYASGGKNPMQGIPSPLKGKHHTPEVCEKIRQAKLKYWSDPKNRKRMGRTCKKWMRTPEAHAKLSVAAKKWRSVPEAKAKFTATAKQGWITRRLKAAA